MTIMRVRRKRNPLWRVDRLFLDDLDMPRFQHLAVARDELIGFLLGENVVIGLADDGLAGDAEELLACPVEQDETKVARVLDEDHCRNVLDDGFEKLPSAEQRAQIGFRAVRSRRLGHPVVAASGNGATLHRPCLTSSDHHGVSRLRRRVATRLTRRVRWRPFKCTHGERPILSVIAASLA
jgi:hypothetical protein